MVNWINSWLQGIIVAVIISTIIEIILPDGTIKKYVKTVIGTYIVFVIVSPVVTKITGKKIDFNAYKMPETKMQKITTIDTNAYIETTYINKIKEDIIKNMKEKGYKVTKVEIDIEQNDNNYGKIKSIFLNISKDKIVSNIEPVEINIKNETNTKEEITEEEAEKIKVYLESNYGATDIRIN